MQETTEKKRVLIVDDDQIVRLLIAKVVRKYNAESVMACDGREARELLNGSEPFALIFLDLFVPHVTGWDLLEEIRTKPAGKGAAIVIFTGAVVSKTEKEALNGKVSAYVNKETFSLAEFDKLVSGFLNP